MNLEDRVGFQDEAAAALFAAARAYRPARSARRRALRALGLPVGLSLLASGAAQGAMALLSAKGVVVLAVVAAAGAGAVAVGGAALVGARGHRPVGQGTRELALTRAAMPAPARTVVVVPAVVVEELGSATDANATTNRTTTATTSTSRSTTVSALAARSRSPVGGTGVAAKRGVAMQAGQKPLAAVEPPPMEDSGSALQAELRLIGAARGALRAGDAGAALRVLDEHARRFPAGAMVEEVALLRMRALVAAGDSAPARALGESFLARCPHSPLAGAVRALLGFSNSRGQEGDRR